ncbi:thiamine-binding protein [Pediococcus pentosaceus]|uniref:thiamine-binding protein n=1 Tax=Pediococcus pentosaceus TaxID=1255 RepID=UPI001F463307|nr:thiamine-binding protein [Pediococcus pentosaceus]
MNTSVAIQVLPIMEDEKKLVAAVDQAIEYIKSTGVNYQVGAFETTLEGDYDQWKSLRILLKLLALRK